MSLIHEQIGYIFGEKKAFELVMAKVDPVSKPHAINEYKYHINYPLLYINKHLVQWRCKSHKSHPHHRMQLRGRLQYSAALPPGTTPNTNK
jgi:hypothetical protein